MVLLQQEDALGDGVHLVGEAEEAVGEVGGAVRVVLDGGAEVFDEQFVVEFEGGEVVAQVGVAGDLGDFCGQDGDGFVPELLELVGGESDVFVVVAEGVELVGLVVAQGAEAGGGEIRRAGDDVTGFVFVEAGGDEEVDLGVEAFGGVGLQLDLARGDVIDELQDAFLDLLRVAGRLNVGGEVGAELAQRLAGVGEEELTPAVVFRHDDVDADADEDAHLGDAFELGTDGEVSGGAQVADEGIEAGEVGVVLEDPLELVEEGVGVVVGEEPGSHAADCVLLTHREFGASIII